MSEITIQAPASGGTTMEITGTAHGPFLIHDREYFPDDAVQIWKVTHVKSGMCFPWVFATKEAAQAFSDEVTAVIDWSAVNTERGTDPNSRTGEWASGEPTKQQQAEAKRLALARGGVRIP